MKKNVITLLAVITAFSLAGCGSSEKGDTQQPANTTAATTAVTTTAAPAETTEPVQETAAETSQSAESSSETNAAVTTAGNSDFDLDAMIASAEAEIPDITAFSGFKDINVDVNLTTGDGKTTTTTAAAKTEKKPETTAAVTTEKPAATTAQETPTANVDSLFTVFFDGTKYSLPISGTLPLPAGWHNDSSAGRSMATFANDSYEGCQIDEVEKGGDTLNGAFISVIEAMKKSKPFPALQMYKGITWGSTVDEIKAQYGEPVHTSNYNQYDCNMTSLYYQDNLGSTMILEVSEEYGLALIEFYRT